MTAVLLISVFVFLAFAIPIGIALGGASLVTLWVGGMPDIIVVQKVMSGINHFTMIAVVFFILAGEVMTEGGVSRKLVMLANRMVGKLPGGLAMVTTLSAMFFGAISGSSAATTAAIGGIMIPPMEKAGYKKDFTAAIVAASGLLGLIIPPSGTMLLYAVIANVSVLEMFIGGIIPGIIMGCSLMVVTFFISKKEGYGTKQIELEEKNDDSRAKVLFHSFMALLSPLIIIGGIYSGIFTTTEASGVSVLYGLLVGVFVFRELTRKRIYNALVKTGIASAVILFLIGAAAVFGWLMTVQQIPTMLTEFISSFTKSPQIVLLLVNIVLLIAGCLLDNVAAITMLTPVLVPLVTSFGIDPTFFGLIMIINLAIGQITPPIGMNLFVASNISGVKLDKIVANVLPFLAVLLVDLFLFTYVPDIVMVLPNLLLKK
ncbi:MAG: TRAP transporter large permease [Treponemataceae bacterium]